MRNYSPRRIISTQTSSGKKESVVAISSKSTLSPFKNEQSQSQSSARKKPFQSPFRDDPFGETKDNGTFMRKVMASPTSISSGHINHDNDQESCVLVSSSRKGNHSLSGSKRRNIDSMHLDRDHDGNDVMVRIRQNLKLNHNGSSDVDSLLEEFNQMSNGSKRIEGNRNRALMHWTDVS